MKRLRAQCGRRSLKTSATARTATANTRTHSTMRTSKERATLFIEAFSATTVDVISALPTRSTKYCALARIINGGLRFHWMTCTLPLCSIPVSEKCAGFCTRNEFQCVLQRTRRMMAALNPNRVYRTAPASATQTRTRGCARTAFWHFAFGSHECRHWPSQIIFSAVGCARFIETSRSPCEPL